MIVLSALLLAAKAAGETPDPPSNVWSRVVAPSGGPSRAIGFYSHGCLAGGMMLPPDGTGYEAIRLERHRNYGHPVTIDFIERLGERAAAEGLPRFRVGDVAQPRGGPLPWGHLSHELGLDADIWFTFDGEKLQPPSQREFPEMGSMLDRKGKVDRARFGPRQVGLLRLAASDPRVDRIFVNPAIKRALCNGFAGATQGGRTWLHKLTPWWGHDDHFHVRLYCPADSPACEPQPPVPRGDGCNLDLDSWGRPSQAVEKPMPLPVNRPAPPAACNAVLNAP